MSKKKVKNIDTKLEKAKDGMYRVFTIIFIDGEVRVRKYKI